MHAGRGKNHVVSSGFVAEATSCLGGSQEYDKDVQQDASEFNGHLLQRLHDEEVARRQLGPQETTEIQNLFYGKQVQQVSPCTRRVIHDLELANVLQTKCSSCNHIIRDEVAFRSLTLQLPANKEPTTVEALIERYLQAESPDDYKCDNCHKKNCTTKKCRISELPQYLILIVNRTETWFDKGWNCHTGKNKTKVSIPTDGLNLRKACSNKSAASKASYTISGFMEHIGSS